MLKIKGARRFETTRFYPFLRARKSGFKYLAIVGLGSNISDEKTRLKALFIALQKDARLRACETSPLLINAAFGYAEQKDFTNAVMVIQTSLHARAFLTLLLHYELKFKRKRSFKNAPRTLDLDLLYFGRGRDFSGMGLGIKRKDDFCFLPHFGADKRESVILPLGLLKGV